MGMRKNTGTRLIWAAGGEDDGLDGRRKITWRMDARVRAAMVEADTFAEFQECELEMRERGLKSRAARRVALARYCPDEVLPLGIDRAESDPAKAGRAGKRRRMKAEARMKKKDLSIEHRGIYELGKPKAKAKAKAKPGGDNDFAGGGGPKPKNNTSEKETRDFAPPSFFDDDGPGVGEIDLGEREVGDNDLGRRAAPDPSRMWPDVGALVEEAKREPPKRKRVTRGKKNRAAEEDEIPDLPPVSRKMFHGKEANEIEVIRWVARNMDIRDVSPEDCPDAAAWRLLKRCRDSKLFEQLFWQSMWTKVVPSRAQIEKEAGPSEMDGTQEIAMIDKIRVAAQKAKDVDAEREREAVEKMMSRTSSRLVPAGTDA